jgi:hypothetical protein
MWSGPRNISTAMMRAFENREDCAVIDEPLYAHYLVKTGIDHPVRDEVIASQPTDQREVIEALLGPIPGNKAIWYQKHMTHHLLPDVERGWMKSFVHCFLIRDPAEVLSSYAKARAEVTLEDLGFVQQAEIFDFVGGDAPVIDSKDVLADPRGMLEALCDALGIPFSERMLSWPSGPRDSDGVWAPHWYQNVWSSTGFAAPEIKPATYPSALQPIVDAAMPIYERLSRARLRPP